MRVLENKEARRELDSAPGGSRASILSGAVANVAEGGAQNRDISKGQRGRKENTMTTTTAMELGLKAGGATPRSRIASVFS